MRPDSNPSNDTLTDEERQKPEILDVMRIVRDVRLFDTIYRLAYALRDDSFTKAVEKAPTWGPGRALSARLGRELGLTGESVKAMKWKSRRRREKGEQISERQAKAVQAALQAATAAYREVMGDEAGEAGTTA